MNTIDFIIIGTYIFLAILVAWLTSRGQDALGFLIANRRLGATMTALTVLAAKIGGGLLVTVSALAFIFGYQAMYLFGGFVCGYVIFYFFAKVLYARSGPGRYFTLPHYFQDRFGISVGRIVAFLTAASTFGWVLTNLIAGGKLIEGISGISFTLSTGLMAAVIATYLLLAGFKAVVRTDAMQFVALIVIMAALIFVIGTKGHLEKLPNVPPVQSMPVGQIIAFFIAGALFPLGSAELWERVYSSRDLGKLKKALVFSSISYVVFGLMMIVVCTAIRSAVAFGDPDIGLIVGLQRIVPRQYTSLVVLAFASAIVSAADTFIYATASIIAQNLWSRTDADYETRMRRIRFLTLPVIGAGWGLALVFANVINTAVFFVSLTLGLAMLTLISWASRTVHPAAMRVGGLALIIGVIGVGIVKGPAPILPMVGIGSVLLGTGLTALWRKVWIKARPVA